jgi:hypothetical protein
LARLLQHIKRPNTYSMQPLMCLEYEPKLGAI